MTTLVSPVHAAVTRASPRWWTPTPRAVAPHPWDAYGAPPPGSRVVSRREAARDAHEVADQMTSPGRSATRTGISSVHRTIDGSVLTAPARLCFIVEERYESDVMPGAVVDVLRSWGHEVDVLRPNGMVADLWDLLFTDSTRYDALSPKTVSEGPGLTLLDAAGAAGITTVNDYRAIRLARDKAVAAVRARAAGIPFPKTWFASRSGLLDQIPADAYPLVVKPNSGSSLKDVYRVNNPHELARLAIDDTARMLAQPY